MNARPAAPSPSRPGQRAAAELVALADRRAAILAAHADYSDALIVARNAGASWRQLSEATGHPTRTIRDHHAIALAATTDTTTSPTNATCPTS